MARREKPKRERKGAYWMDTYGDMVTLLLAFFVMLFASSQVNEAKWMAIVASFSGQPVGAIVEPIDPLNPTNGLTSADLIQEATSRDLRDESGENEDDYDDLNEEQVELREQINELYEELEDYVQIEGLELAVQLEKDGRLIYVTIQDIVLFDSGSAEIRDGEAAQVLTDLGNMFSEYWEAIEHIRVEGHTDNVPIQTDRYKNNRFLSSARADEVLYFMQETTGLPADAPGQTKIEAVGMAETDPVAPNDSDENRQKNRRVEFAIEGLY